MEQNNARRGFTLIELLVVVIIIAILAAIALPQYQKAVEKSRITEAVTVLRSLQKAYQLCVLEHGEPDHNGTHPCDAENAEGLFKNAIIEIPGTKVDDANDCNTPGCFYTQDWQYDYEEYNLDAYRLPITEGGMAYMLSLNLQSGEIICQEDIGSCQKVCGGNHCVVN